MVGLRTKATTGFASTRVGRIGRDLSGALVAALILALVILITMGWSSRKVPEPEAFFSELQKKVAEEVILGFAGAVIVELWAVLKAIDSMHPALASIEAELPLITKMSESSLLAKAAGPLIEQTAEIDVFDAKQKELACCLLTHSAERMQVILNSNNWRTEGVLFQQVRDDIATLTTRESDGRRHRVVSAYLMSLINPTDWSKAPWGKYQESLSLARLQARANGSEVDFKRIHVLHEPDTREPDVWKEFVSLMIAEAIMGIHVQAMLLESTEVTHSPNTQIGYIAAGAHLYDCGVYQGVKTRFVVLADLDPYFIMDPRKAVNSALVSHDVGLLDILRRNFNTAWRCPQSKSLYHLLKAPRPSSIVGFVPAKSIAKFVEPPIEPSHLAPLLKLLADMDRFHTKRAFWDAFDAATPRILVNASAKRA